MGIPNRSRAFLLTRCLAVVGSTLLCSIAIDLTMTGVCNARTVDESDQSYLVAIKPILEKHCYACHGGIKQEAGLRLDTAELILKGSDSGPILDPQNIEQSELLKRITANDDSLMPPKHEGERLKAEQVNLITDWLNSGVKVIPNEQPSISPNEHWAFRPIERPALPKGALRSQTANPIDHLLAEHIAIDSSASLVTLLRRLSIDLRGIPLEEDLVASLTHQGSTIGGNGNGFADSQSTYDSMVERWLADAAYGERWGRHWMDVWRYSDWWGLGEELRNSQLHMWHWRDWIVESLNENMPYDEMLRQMIAADELYPDAPQKLRATGFLARNFFLFNRNQWMEETIEHVGKGMLGLTMNCAKCHDHKYDPVSQVDYYRFRAIFEPYQVRLDMIEGEPDLRKNGLPRIFDRDLDSPTYLFVRGEDAKPDKANPLSPGVPSFLTFRDYKPEPVTLPRAAFQPETSETTIRTYVAKAESRISDLETKLQSARSKQNDLESKLQGLEKHPNDRLAGAHEPPPVTDDWNESNDIESTKKRWALYGGDWNVADGRLHQSSSKPDRGIARLIHSIPSDFDADLSFATHGGNQWKSVGISFDCTDVNPLDGYQSGDHEVSVYASAYAGEQKIQIAYLQNAQWVYPADAKVIQPIELNQTNRFRIVVRDKLINVYWNDKNVLAWTLPFPRESGTVQLTTFDAQASFDRFAVAALEETMVLKLPNGEPSYSNKTSEGIEAQLIEANKDAKLVELELAVAREELAFHRARLMDHDAATKNHLALATATYQLALAQRSLDRSDEKSREQKAHELDKAKQFYDKVSQGDVSEFQTTYPGAKWSATRFQFSGKDDPDRAFPELSSGRRKELAAWITSPDNPLTARVAVNHIWIRHFGEPLVQDAFDFGMKSKRPERLDLLNWLAAELIEHHWDMKHLHRLIVKSNYYKSLHRSVPRLESQAVRDSVLALAGKLDRTLGGPTIPLSEQSTSNRRSLYFFHSNNERNLFLTMFDEALVTECYRRDESIVPQQALALGHSRIILDSVPALAERIKHHTGQSAEHFVRFAFAWILGLEPTNRELELCQALLNETDDQPQASNNTSNETGTTNHFSKQEELVWVLLNHHHFLQVP